MWKYVGDDSQAATSESAIYTTAESTCFSGPSVATLIAECCHLLHLLIYATCQCSSQQGLLQRHEYLRRLYICLQEYVQCWSATGKSLLHPTEMLCKHLPVAVAAHTKIIEACPTISDPQQYYQHHAPANRNHTQHIHLQQ